MNDIHIYKATILVRKNGPKIITRVFAHSPEHAAALAVLSLNDDGVIHPVSYVEDVSVEA